MPVAPAVVTDEMGQREPGHLLVVERVKTMLQFLLSSALDSDILAGVGPDGSGAACGQSVRSLYRFW